MRFEDFAFINDPKNGLVCCCVPVSPATEEMTRGIRSFYAERVTRFGYSGFSWEIDDFFHQRSVYLVVTDGSGNLVMTCRGTHRRPGEVLPFEMATRDDGTSYVLDPERPVMDFNTYTYQPGAYEIAMPLQIVGLRQLRQAPGSPPGLLPLRRQERPHSPRLHRLRLGARPRIPGPHPLLQLWPPRRRLLRVRPMARPRMDRGDDRAA